MIGLLIAVVVRCARLVVNATGAGLRLGSDWVGGVVDAGDTGPRCDGVVGGTGVPIGIVLVAGSEYAIAAEYRIASSAGGHALIGDAKL